MRSLNVVLIVTTSTPLTVNNFPGLEGLLGLIVATSNAGLALAAIRVGGGGGSGIAQAVSEVARAKFNGAGGPPWDHVPTIELPSALIVAVQHRHSHFYSRTIRCDRARRYRR